MNRTREQLHRFERKRARRRKRLGGRPELTPEQVESRAEGEAAKVVAAEQALKQLGGVGLVRSRRLDKKLRKERERRQRKDPHRRREPVRVLSKSPYAKKMRERDPDAPPVLALKWPK